MKFFKLGLVILVPAILTIVSVTPLFIYRFMNGIPYSGDGPSEAKILFTISGIVGVITSYYLPRLFFVRKGLGTKSDFNKIWNGKK